MREIEFVPVEGHENLYKEEGSGGCVNTNFEEISNARKMKEIRLARLKRQDIMEKEIGVMKKDIVDIKNILEKIAEKL